MKNKSPKIIVQIPSFDIGGAERQAFQFAQYYKDNSGGDIEIFGFFNPGKISQWCESSGISWRLVPYPNSRFLPLRFFTMGRLIREFRKAKPDIILPYTFVPNVLCGLIWKWTGAKLCIWNQRDEGSRYDNALLERLALKNIDHIISNSYQGARFLENNFDIRNRPIKIIPNGVLLPEPVNNREQWRNSLKINNETKLVCMVANLTERKDHKTLLRSWRKVIDNFSDDVNKPILLLAGKKYEMYDSLNTLIDELDLHEYVRFLGQVEDISGLLNSVDLGVHSSKLEGCSNGLLECMAAGLAVIATDIDANREALGKDNEQCLVPVDNHEILAEKIIEFLNNEQIRKQYGSTNNKRIHQTFSLEQTNKKMMNYVISTYEKRD
jgi:glycosyltransferase involved in cell wall biosynthesis